MNQFGQVWDEAEDGLGSAEVVPPDDYAVECTAAEVGDNDRIWTLWTITQGPDAGTTFFGSSYGLSVKDPSKAKKVAGFFKGAMISFGVDEAFFRNATTLDDFAAAIKGVQGWASVKTRTFKGKDGEERQSNEIKSFKLTGRPPLPSVGGVPNLAITQPVPQVEQSAAPAILTQPGQPVLPGGGTPLAGVPGSADGPPSQPPNPLLPQPLVLPQPTTPEPQAQPSVTVDNPDF